VEIYLMRHGAAASADQHPARPLTAAGRAAIERVAWRAATARIQPSVIYHSGVLRAEQTAEIVGRQLGIAVRSRDGLRPEDDIMPTARQLLEQTHVDGTLMIVGHLPFLDYLTSVLVADEPEAYVVDFQPGSLVRLEPKPLRNGYVIRWLLAPEVA
jgi:phosphohistidine phosphatase